jgi:hypothetical protein
MRDIRIIFYLICAGELEIVEHGKINFHHYEAGDDYSPHYEEI